MRSTLLQASLLSCALGSACATPTPATPTNGVATPSPIQTGMTPNCNKFYLVAPGDGCFAIASTYSISLDDFYAWNPAAGNNCESLWANTYACVGVLGGSTTEKPTPTAVPSDENGVATPTPVQPGMVDHCKKFYNVQTGDGCWAIADTNKISLDDFYKWNPAVKTDCSRLWAQYYVCVGL